MQRPVSESKVASARALAVAGARSRGVREADGAADLTDTRRAHRQLEHTWSAW